MQPRVEHFFHEPTNSLSYLLWEEGGTRAAVVDPVLDYEAAAGRTATRAAEGIARRLEALGLQLAYILETHVHADHLSAAPFLKERLGGLTAIGAGVVMVQRLFREVFAADDLAADGSQWDLLLSPGASLPLDRLAIEAMATPGHTPACMTYLAGDAAFVGDTLFAPDYGSARCDFPGGDAAALYRSIQALLALPEETRLFLCHDYRPGGRDLRWQTTVGEQRGENVHLKAGTSEAAFVGFRRERDATLSMPALMIPAVQVNIRGGRLPPPEENGTRYLKIPLDRL